MIKKLILAFLDALGGEGEKVRGLNVMPVFLLVTAAAGICILAWLIWQMFAWIQSL